MPNSKPNTSGLLSGSNRTWANTPTTTIRVPEKLSDRILSYARDIDSGKKPDTDVTADLDKIRLILKNALDLKSNSGGAIKLEIAKALELLGVNCKINKTAGTRKS